MATDPIEQFHIVNLSELNAFDNGTTVDAAALIEKGLVRDTTQPVKILGEGELTKKLTVVVGWYSKSALDKITAAGGTAQNLKGEVFAFPKPKKKFVPREAVKKPKKVAEEPAPEAAAKGPAKPEAAPAEEAKPAE